MTAGNDIKLRPYADTDHEIVSGFLDALNAHENKITGDRATTMSEARKHLDFVLDAASENGFAIVAEHDGKVIGTVIGRVDELEGHYAHPKRRIFGEILDLFVIPDMRGSGAADQLMQAAEEYFRSKGVERIILLHVTGNTVAEAFYKKQGYTPYETIIEKSLK